MVDDEINTQSLTEFLLVYSRLPEFMQEWLFKQINSISLLRIVNSYYSMKLTFNSISLPRIVNSLFYQVNP